MSKDILEEINTIHYDLEKVSKIKNKSLIQVDEKKGLKFLKNNYFYLAKEANKDHYYCIDFHLKKGILGERSLISKKNKIKQSPMTFSNFYVRTYFHRFYESTRLVDKYGKRLVEIKLKKIFGNRFNYILISIKNEKVLLKDYIREKASVNEDFVIQMYCFINFIKHSLQVKTTKQPTILFPDSIPHLDLIKKICTYYLINVVTYANSEGFNPKTSPLTHTAYSGHINHYEIRNFDQELNEILIGNKVCDFLDKEKTKKYKTPDSLIRKKKLHYYSKNIKKDIIFDFKKLFRSNRNLIQYLWTSAKLKRKILKSSKVNSFMEMLYEKGLISAKETIPYLSKKQPIKNKNIYHQLILNKKDYGFKYVGERLNISSEDLFHEKDIDIFKKLLKFYNEIKTPESTSLLNYLTYFSKEDNNSEKIEIMES